VNYMHLVDQARVRIEQDYTRPLPERALRAMLGLVLPRPGLVPGGHDPARLARPFIALAAGAQSRRGIADICGGA